MNPLRPYERLHPLKQFLENDGKTLRFYCLWDDTDSLFGDQRELVLHYYLADDTVEIIEVIPPNSGRVHVSKFLRRCKLPKVRANEVSDTLFLLHESQDQKLNVATGVDHEEEEEEEDK